MSDNVIGLEHGTPAAAPARPRRCGRSFSFLVLLLTAFLPLLALAADSGVTVDVDRSQIYVGESVLLQVRVSGSRIGMPDLSAIHGADVRLLGSTDDSHWSISYINGHMQREGFSGRVYTYQLTPAQPGAFTCGPVHVTVDGREQAADGPAIQVQGIERQDVVDVSVEASREAVLVDEPFDIRLRVLIRRLKGRFADTDPLLPNAPPQLNVPYLDGQGLDGLDGPDLNQTLQSKLISDGRQPGFLINNYQVQNNNPFDGFFNFEDPFAKHPARFRLDRQFVEQDGQAYAEYSLTLHYAPRKEGHYTFGPVVFKGNIPVDVTADGHAQTRNVFTVGPAMTVRVVPPPEEGRPESYVGALGSNLTVDASVDSPTCNVGDPLRLTLRIAGDVQMRNLTPPHLSLQSNLVARFEVYEDNIQTIKKDGAREYVYTLRPREAGSYEVPPIAISYYDVGPRRYRTVFSPPIPIKARRVSEVTAAQIVGAISNAPAAPTGGRPDAMAPAAFSFAPSGAVPTPLLDGPTAGALAALGPLTFALAAAVRFSRPVMRRVRERRRRRNACGRARHRLAGARRLLPRDPAAARRILCASMRTYLTERFDLVTAGLTPPETEQTLCARGVPAATARGFREILERNFNASFSGSADAHGIEEDIVRARQALATIDRESSRRSRGGTAA